MTPLTYTNQTGISSVC